MDVVVPHDQQYGSRLENGTWTGIVGQVASREVDMSAIPLIINANRNRVVDPGFPLISDPVVLSYIKPVQRADLAGFIKPFTLQVWGSLLAVLAVVLAGLVVMQITDARPYSVNTCVKRSQVLEREVWWAAFQWTVTAPLAQGKGFAA
ncbi:hypothetical protein O3P69_017672 [Scylla paramamosain]|uniref:Ionotropic glutamate receptor L-glutamate and glycine-binding domain-containing protein n=1 Tax=Scylla paramamosain TaxID=85552 RepID=A0AAW0TXH3_SCYPA